MTSDRKSHCRRQAEPTSMSSPQADEYFGSHHPAEPPSFAPAQQEPAAPVSASCRSDGFGIERQIFDALHAARQIQSLRELNALIRPVADELGFPECVCVECPPFLSPPRITVFFGEPDRIWVENYNVVNLAASDRLAATSPKKGDTPNSLLPAEPLSFEPHEAERAPASTLKSSLFNLGLQGPEGDAICVRDFVDRLLQRLGPGHDRPEARLLLTALCLHLSCLNGPDATAADLLAWLEAGRGGVQAFKALCDSPMQLLVFAYAELVDLSPNSQSKTIDLCVDAVKLLGS